MKRIFALLTALVLALGTFCALPAMAEENGIDSFDAVLNLYLRGLSGDEAMLETEEFNASAYLCCLSAEIDPLDGVGYAFLDLNGVSALLIGETDALEEDGFLFDVWTLSDGKPVLSLRGWERNRAYLTLDGEAWGYYAEGANSAFESVYQRGTALQADGAWQETHTLICLYDENEQETWTLDGEQYLSGQADKLLTAWSKNVIHPALSAFREWKKEANRFGFTDDETPAADEKSQTCSVQVYEGGPILDIVVTDAGQQKANNLLENTLCVSVSQRAGRLRQQILFSGDVLPDNAFSYRIVRFEDMNSDGFLDLVLLTAMGAYNEFSVFCLWNPNENRFDPVMTHRAFNLETEQFDADPVPMEILNYSCADGALTSYEKNGYAWRTEREYVWADSATPVLHCVFDVYDAGSGLIGDRLYVFGEQPEKVWDHVYAEDWYYGDGDGAFDAREAAAFFYANGKAVQKQVAQTDRASLHETDAKDSPLLATLDAGAKVLVLFENCSEGWDLALYVPENGENVIGYIWHSFLSPIE